MNKKVTPAEVIEALERSHGFIGLAAKQLGISRTAIEDLKNKGNQGKILKEKHEDMLETNHEMVRLVLFKKASMERDLKSIQYYCKLNGLEPNVVEPKNITPDAPDASAIANRIFDELGNVVSTKKP